METGERNVTSSSSRNTGRRPEKRYAVEWASSYARRIRKPPNTRPAVLRCWGCAMSAFCSVVSEKSISRGSASVGMASNGFAPARSSCAYDTVSASRVCPYALALSRARSCFRASSRLAPRANAASSPLHRRRGLMVAERLLPGSRATNVKLASRNGSEAHVDRACMLISMLERPTHVTRPLSSMSSTRFGRCRYTIRSTLAVTSSRSGSPGVAQC